MKKLLPCLLCLSAAACAQSNRVSDEISEQQEARNIEINLAQSKDTKRTLDFFKRYYHDACSTDLCYKNSDVELFGIKRVYYSDFLSELYNVTTVDLNADKECFKILERKTDGNISWVDNSDDCILARRNGPKTDIGYFNFKKYLPVGNVIKTERQFLDLYALYLVIQKNKNDCRLLYNVSQVTTDEKERCGIDKEKFLQDFAMGRAKKCSVKYGKEYKQYIEDNTSIFVPAFDDGLDMKFAADYLCVPDKITKFFVVH